MPPRKILIFSLAYFPHVGGAEVAIKEITDRIAPDDIEFHMLTLQLGNEPAEEKLGNVSVHRIGWGSSYVAKIFFVPRGGGGAARRPPPPQILYPLRLYLFNKF
jgi:hypothetical protein